MIKDVDKMKQKKTVVNFHFFTNYDVSGMTYIALSRTCWYAGATHVRVLEAGGLTHSGLDGGLAPGGTCGHTGAADVVVLLTGGITLACPHGLLALVRTLHRLRQAVAVRLRGGGGGRRRWRRVQPCLL